MDKNTWRQFTSYEGLLAIGVTLAVAGIMLRGFAASTTRAAALRKQHWLHNRKPGETDPAEKERSWFDKRLPIIATIVTITGVAVTFLSFFGK
jgi:hypothetical protein